MNVRYSLLCSLNLKMNREILEQVLTRIRSVFFFCDDFCSLACLFSYVHLENCTHNNTVNMPTYVILIMRNNPITTFCIYIASSNIIEYNTCIYPPLYNLFYFILFYESVKIVNI